MHPGMFRRTESGQRTGSALSPTIPSTTLSRAGITTTRLGFGTSRLHHLSGRKRQHILSAAYDLGIFHFDTAPAYGDGVAERELGRLIQGKRSDIVVATKYGLPYNAAVANWPALAFPVSAGRALARRSGILRRRLPLITAVGLRKSVEASLRRLKTDFIDILFLHDPSPLRIDRIEDVASELAAMRERGLIRAYGLAGRWSGVAPLLQSAPELAQVVQVPDAEWTVSFMPDITYGAIAQGAQSYFMPAVAQDSALERLRAALARRANGTVLVSTNKVEHLRRLAAVFEAGAS
jgi:D-threo-aldose 1-dehydrogenase